MWEKVNQTIVSNAFIKSQLPKVADIGLVEASLHSDLVKSVSQEWIRLQS